MEPRLRARRVEIRQAARRHRRRFVASAGVVALLAGLCAGALYSPLLEIRHITVLGAGHLTPSEVIGSSGIRVGSRLIDVDSRAAAQRVGRQPWVRTVTVTRNWPDGVTIRIQERAAVAVVGTPSGTRLVVSTGRRIAGLAGPFDQGLPLVTLPASAKVRIGTVLSAPVASAVEMLGAVPVDILSRSTGAAVSADGDLTLGLRPSGQLWFGNSDQARQKFMSAEAILGGSVSLNNLKRLDVRIPAAPTVLREP
jgi:cell division protein FtsQ